jgi:hypothetical protein
VASSLVERLRGGKRLGSYLFFQRGKVVVQTPNALWRLVAFDFSQQYPTIRKALVAKLESDHKIPITSNIDKLFQQIIQEPLVKSDGIPEGRLPVIVIDALDECGGLDGPHSPYRRNVLRTLSTWSKLSRRFKIVVTSRDEDDIKRTLQNISRVITISAGSDVSDQSLTDITKYLITRFGEIAEPYPSLGRDWPGPQVIRQLGDKAGGLFIWAKVVAEFIARGEPTERLRLVEAGTGGTGDMAALYSQILQVSFPAPITPEVIEAFHSTIGAIILAEEPLTAASLAQLLGIQTTRVEHICKELKSVVNSEDVLRITHQSFVDFLIDTAACPSSYRIRLEDEQHKLTLACLRTMKRGLRFNICKLESSYALNSEVVDMESRIKDNIPSHLRYASLYWSSHLSDDQFDEEVLELLHEFMRKQFLFWLEVMSVTKRMNVAARMLSLLIDWMKVRFVYYLFDR